MQTTKKYVIDVGGREFVTTKDTLYMSPFLQGLLTFTEEGQVIFVDRDPCGFKHVLRRLRNPEYEIPDRWLSEWTFYCPPSSEEESRQEEPEQVQTPQWAVDRMEPYEFFANIHPALQIPDLLAKSKQHADILNQMSYIDMVIKLYPSASSGNITYFTPHRTFDRLLYPLVDPDIVGEGVLEVGGNHEFTFGKSGTFLPINLLLCPFHEVRIRFNARMEKLYLAVRIYQERERSNLIHKVEHVIPEKGIGYKHGCLFGFPTWPSTDEIVKIVQSKIKNP